MFRFLVGYPSSLWDCVVLMPYLENAASMELRGDSSNGKDSKGTFGTFPG